MGRGAPNLDNLDSLNPGARPIIELSILFIFGQGDARTPPSGFNLDKSKLFAHGPGGGGERGGLGNLMNRDRQAVTRNRHRRGVGLGDLVTRNKAAVLKN